MGQAPVEAPKLLSEGRHPTVLLYAEVAGSAAGVCNRIKTCLGHVVRQRGTQFTAIFSGFDTHAPANAGLAAAKEIVEQGGRAALHLAQITIRRKERGAPQAYGVAVERPNSWLPREWSGVLLTEEMQAILENISPRPSPRLPSPLLWGSRQP